MYVCIITHLINVFVSLSQISIQARFSGVSGSAAFGGVYFSGGYCQQAPSPKNAGINISQ